MKKYLLLLFTALFLFSQDQLLANTVIVRGYVKDSIGNPIVNRTVKVFTNDSSQGCIFTHIVTTNSNGYYIDTVSCNTTIKNIFVKVEDCKGQWVIKNPAITTSGDVEVNFIICRPGTNLPAQCKALFQYSLTETGIKFSSTPSEIAPGDSIISRTWVFGDSSAKLYGNQADPWHEYKKAGNYNVCLTIKTKKGCESNYCKTILFQPKPADSCVVKINITTEKLSARKFRFSSKATTVAPGDSIIKRNWSFGDGTGNEGNEISPAKEYKDTGVYQVCLKVKTKRGCENKYCFTVGVRDSIVRPTACKASFTFTYKDSVAYFNSAASTAPDGDSIISRTWFYVNGNDTLKLEGNVIDTFIPYNVPGKYTVFLTIKTKKGCTSTYTGEVKVPEQPNACNIQLAIKHEKLASRKFRFSSSQSIAAADSIMKRKWKFGDGTIFEGNDPNPLKEYKDTGAYTVCLYIKTKKGCEKEICIQVWIKDSTRADSIKPASCKIQPQFTVARMSGKKVLLNSMQTIAQPGDSVISRKWNFGDGSIMDGNTESPIKEYNTAGTYNVCLVVKTKKGCEASICKTVSVLDSIPQILHNVKIISLNPNPVITRMLATINSSNMNTEVEISVIDIYGAVKFSFKKLLSQGNNIVEVITANLPKGPYFLKVVSRGTKDSKLFYKL